MTNSTELVPMAHRTEIEGVVLRAEPGLPGSPRVNQPIAHRMNRPWRSTAWLEATYAMPKPTRSLEEFLRRQHQDLPSLSGLDIDLELDAVRSRLRFEPNPRHVVWLHERADLLTEWRRRWFGEEPNKIPILSRNPHALEGCGCGNGSTAAPALPGTSPSATTMITVRGRGRGR